METLLKRWWWPLDAEVGADGYVWVFLAEMYNPNRHRGDERALLPAGTWVARAAPATISPSPRSSLPPSRLPTCTATRSSRDDTWTYLYANCYRQFVPGQLLGFDPACSPVRLSGASAQGPFRPAPRALDAPTGGRSIESASRAGLPWPHDGGELAVQRYGDTYVNVNDDGEWFGPTIEIWTARQPQGPWTLAVAADVPTKCGDDCFHYGAFLLPDRDSGRVGVLLSHNSRIVSAGENENAWQYRQSVLQFDVPGIVLASAMLAPPDEPPIAPMPIVLAAGGRRGCRLRRRRVARPAGRSSPSSRLTTGASAGCVVAGRTPADGGRPA